YAISWGYKPIFEAKTSAEEADVLNSWINKHAGDPIYRFAEGDVNGSDPSSQRESLGDDIVKASKYGVKNIRFIISNLEKWMAESGAKYDKLEDFLLAALRQYERYYDHTSVLIAGVHQRYPVQGQNELMYEYASKKEQQEAVQFIISEFKSLPNWLGEALGNNLHIVDKQNGIKKFIPLSTYVERLYKGKF